EDMLLSCLIPMVQGCSGCDVVTMTPSSSSSSSLPRSPPPPCLGLADIGGLFPDLGGRGGGAPLFPVLDCAAACFALSAASAASCNLFASASFLALSAAAFASLSFRSASTLSSSACLCSASAFASCRSCSVLARSLAADAFSSSTSFLASIFCLHRYAQ